jgi:hypothetical protein
MSLTKHLKSRGPVRDWFMGQLPHTRDFAEAQNIRIRAGGGSCRVPSVEGSDAQFVGTAVEYVLRAHLVERAQARTTATGGAADLDRRPELQTRPCEVERRAVARIDELAPWRRALSAEEWTLLLQAAVVLARLEQWFRSRDRVWAYVAAPIIRYGVDLDALGSVMADAPTYRDLDQLARAVREDHAGLREAQQLVLGPTFAQSPMLGGADGDVVADGVLLDFKSTAGTRIVGRDELWQLVGYMLADTYDAHRIHSLSIAALRWRETAVWPPDIVLAALSGADRSVAEWREEFATVLADIARDAGRPVATLGVPPDLEVRNG